jgi:hypothetical protein
LSSISPTLPPGNRLSGAGGSFSGPPESGSRKSTVRSVYLREIDFASSPAEISFLSNLSSVADQRCEMLRFEQVRKRSDSGDKELLEVKKIVTKLSENTG